MILSDNIGAKNRQFRDSECIKYLSHHGERGFYFVLISMRNLCMDSPSSEAMNSSNDNASNKYLIIMCGMPGAGKTTVANIIKNYFSTSKNVAILSRYPFLYKSLFFNRVNRKRDLEKLRDESFYYNASNKVKNENYDVVIFDGTHHKKCKREKAYEFAKKNKLTKIVLECVCPDEEVLKWRLKNQIEKGSKKLIGCQVEEIVEKYKQDYENTIYQEQVDYYIQYDTIEHNIRLASRQKGENEFIRELCSVLECFQRNSEKKCRRFNKK